MKQTRALTKICSENLYHFTLCLPLSTPSPTSSSPSTSLPSTPFALKTSSTSTPEPLPHHPLHPHPLPSTLYRLTLSPIILDLLSLFLLTLTRASGLTRALEGNYAKTIAFYCRQRRERACRVGEKRATLAFHCACAQKLASDGGGVRPGTLMDILT